jgi:hypothetical protein
MAAPINRAARTRTNHSAQAPQAPSTVKSRSATAQAPAKSMRQLNKENEDLQTQVDELMHSLHAANAGKQAAKTTYEKAMSEKDEQIHTLKVQMDHVQESLEHQLSSTNAALHKATEEVREQASRVEEIEAAQQQLVKRASEFQSCLESVGVNAVSLQEWTQRDAEKQQDVIMLEEQIQKAMEELQDTRKVLQEDVAREDEFFQTIAAVRDQLKLTHDAAEQDVASDNGDASEGDAEDDASDAAAPAPAEDAAAALGDAHSLASLTALDEGQVLGEQTCVEETANDTTDAAGPGSAVEAIESDISPPPQEMSEDDVSAHGASCEAGTSLEVEEAVELATNSIAAAEEEETISTEVTDERAEAGDTDKTNGPCSVGTGGEGPASTEGGDVKEEGAGLEEAEEDGSEAQADRVNNDVIDDGNTEDDVIDRMSLVKDDVMDDGNTEVSPVGDAEEAAPVPHCDCGVALRAEAGEDGAGAEEEDGTEEGRREERACFPLVVQESDDEEDAVSVMPVMPAMGECADVALSGCHDGGEVAVREAGCGGVRNDMDGATGVEEGGAEGGGGGAEDVNVSWERRDSQAFDKTVC